MLIDAMKKLARTMTTSDDWHYELTDAGSVARGPGVEELEAETSPGDTVGHLIVQTDWEGVTTERPDARRSLFMNSWLRVCLASRSRMTKRIGGTETSYSRL